VVVVVNKVDLLPPGEVPAGGNVIFHIPPVCVIERITAEYAEVRENDRTTRGYRQGCAGIGNITSRDL
jgi:hypothetical protein